MSGRSIGYFRPDMVTDPGATAEQMRRSAHVYGTELTAVFGEPADGLRQLWQLVEIADDGTGVVKGRLEQTARARGVDLRALLAAPAPAAGLLGLLDTVSRAPDGFVLVPSRAHLGGPGIDPDTVQRLLSRVAPQVEVVYVDNDAVGQGSDSAGVLIDMEVPAVAAAETLLAMRARTALARIGLADMVEPVCEILAALLNDMLRAAESEPGTTARVRLLCATQASGVVVEAIESRPHVGDSLPEPVRRLCATGGAQAGRAVDRGGGTRTWAWLPFPAASSSSAGDRRAG